MKRCATWLIAAALAWTPAISRAAPDPDAARVELDAGLAAYGREDYAVALLHFEKAYALDPSPHVLYAWAQAARSAGDCETAISLYRRFIDAGATGDSRVAAEQNEQRCREQLADAEVVPEPPPVPVPPPRPVDVQPSTPPPTPPRRDPIGGALVGSGAAVLVAGVVVLAVAGAVQSKQARTRDYDRFDALDARIDRLWLAGGITGGIGAIVLTAGAARLGLLRKRSRSPAAACRSSDRHEKSTCVRQAGRLWRHGVVP